MTTPNTLAAISAAASPAMSADAPLAPVPPGWPRLSAALFLPGAAQLITIPALVSADPHCAASLFQALKGGGSRWPAI